jgi:hypothetical protein
MKPNDFEARTTDPLEPRYERFLIRYPSGTVIESSWLIEGGGTVQQVRLEHPLGVVEANEDSQVHVEAAP